MFSSFKTKDIKDNVKDVASEARSAANDIADDTREAISRIASRAADRGHDVQSEVEVLLAKLSDLLKSAPTQDFRSRVRRNVESIGDWASEHEHEIANAVSAGTRKARKVIYERPYVSLAVAAGVAAVLAYWLTRPSHKEQPED